MPKLCGPEGCIDTDEEIVLPSIMDVLAKFSSYHAPDPIWDKPTNGIRLICQVCRKLILGTGTVSNPWVCK